MFTSRAEFRILLRQDNADSRLTRIGFEIGLASNTRMVELEHKEASVKELNQFIENYSIEPSVVNSKLAELGTSEIIQKIKFDKIITRPQTSIFNFLEIIPQLSTFDKEILEEVEILIKYSGYIEKEKHLAEKLIRLDKKKIKPDFDYLSIKSLSKESREKLSKQQPESIGQASRISGVSPADVSILLVHLGR